MSEQVRMLLFIVVIAGGCVRCVGGNDGSPSDAFEEGATRIDAETSGVDSGDFGGDSGPPDAGPSSIDGGDAGSECIEAEGRLPAIGCPCDAGEPCRDGGWCYDGTCAPHDFVHEGPCERSSQCYPGNWCRAGSCTGMTPCQEDLECGEDASCYRGECVAWNKCTQGEACVGDRPCVDGHCLPDYCADCGADEHCGPGSSTDYCIPHAECTDTGYTTDPTGCQAWWSDCSGSGGDHQFTCSEGDDGWACICRGDEYVEVELAADPCRRGGIHRVANWTCGWELPGVE